MELTGPVERGLIELNSNEWRVQACPDLKWKIPDPTSSIEDKTLHIWTHETLGEHHCQQDNIPNAVRLKFDWLADHLK